MRNLILVLFLFIVSNVFADNYTYLKGPQLAESNQSIASSAGVTQLTALSPMKTAITGTLAHTIKLPDTTTIPVGYSYQLINKSTQALAVQDFASSSLGAIAANSDKTFILFSGGVWNVSSGGSSGKTLVGTAPINIVQDSTTATFSFGTTNFIDFNTSYIPTLADGRLFFDQNDKTLSLVVDSANSISLQVGQEQFIRAVNKTGASINDGDVVYISGAQGNRPTIAKATGTLPTGPFTVAVATQSIANNDEGMVTTSGVVGSYNTSGFTDGARLYLSQSTAGALTATRPTTGLIVPVGWALNSTIAGKILVDIGPVLDATTTLANNSDLFAPTQKAVKAYIDGAAPSITGTANYVAKFTGTGLTASQIFDNGTNVGIRTATATATLEVNAPNASSGSYAFKAFNSSNTPLLFLRNDGGISIGTSITANANTITIQKPTSASIALISEGGYPGLNNYNYSNVASEQPYSLTYRARGTATTPLGVLGNDNLGAFGFRGHDGTSFSADVASIRAYAGSDFTTSSRETYMSFYTTTASATGGAERFRITGAGNLAIGTSTAQARVDILSSAASSFPANSGTTQSGLITRMRTGGSNSTLDFGGNSSNGSWLQATNTSNLATLYPLLLNPNGGNVGIGNTAPATALHVTGDVTQTGYHYFGLPSVNGSYRMFVSSGALVTEKRVSGVWTEVARLNND